MHCVQVRFSSLLHNVKVTVLHVQHSDAQDTQRSGNCIREVKLYAAWKSARGCAVNHLLKKQNYGRLSLSELYDHKPEPTIDSTFQTVSSLEHKGGKKCNRFSPFKIMVQECSQPITKVLYVVCNSADTMCCCCC